LTNTGDEERGLQPGTADYITKPITPAVVLARVHTQLETEVTRCMTENDLTQRVSIQAPGMWPMLFLPTLTILSPC